MARGGGGRRAARDVAVLLEAMAVRRADVRVVALGPGEVDALLAIEETLLRAGIYRYEVCALDVDEDEGRLAQAVARQATD